MRIFSVAETRKELARIIEIAQKEEVVVTCRGKPCLRINGMDDHTVENFEGNKLIEYLEMVVNKLKEKEIERRL